MTSSVHQRRPPSGRRGAGSLLSWASLLVAVPMLGGCASDSPLATVSGTVRRGDQPLEGLLVTFLPDPSQQTPGAHASAVTDESGTYELVYRGREDAAGAVIGWHKVVIEDFAAENSRAAPTARRVPAQYRLAATTPLDVEVQPGEQRFDFQLESQ